MVSVKKKEDIISYFSSLKLKIQLMSNFTVITILSCIVISLLIVLFIQNKITNRILEDSTTYVVGRVQLEMKNILTQMVTVFQSSLFNIGQLIIEVESTVKDVFLINPIYNTPGVYTVQTPGVNPYPPSGSQAQVMNQITACQGPNTNLASICPMGTGNYNVPPSNYDTYKFASFYELDNYVPFLKDIPYLTDKIFRMIIQTYAIDPNPDPMRNIFKVYPAHNIDDTLQAYNINGKMYNDQRTYAAKYPSRVYIQGPYDVNVPSTGETVSVMSLSTTFMDSNIYYHIRYEMKMQVIDDFVTSHGFRSKNEIIVLQKKGTFVYSSTYWKIKGPSSYIFDANMQSYSGLDEATFQSLINNQKQITVQKLNDQGDLKDYLITPILLKDGYDPNNITDYLQSGVSDLVLESFFIILMYAEKNQMYEVLDTIQNLTDKQESITSRICIVTSFITIVIVYVATYLVSVSVDRPLRALINILKKLNNSVTIKQNALIRIKDELEYLETISEFQVKELVKSFKSLIETLIDRNQNNRNNLIKPKIDYPLNELEINFVKKTKGNQSEFDWEKLINSIQNKSKFPDEKKKVGEANS